MNSEEVPVSLTRWLSARLASLGLDGPRDARDAVTPLWEMPLREQHAFKAIEMDHLLRTQLAPSSRRDAVEMDDLAIEMDRLHRTQLASPAGPPETLRCEPLRCEALRCEPEALRCGALRCEPLRFAAGEDAAAACAGISSCPTTSTFVPARDVCDLHVGFDRECLPCCGFRLGLAGSVDGRSVASPGGVPIVPEWMVAVAAELTAWLCERATGAAQSATAAAAAAAAAAPPPPAPPAPAPPPPPPPPPALATTLLPYTSLKLRGSMRTHEAMAMLTLTPSVVIEGTAEVLLAKRMVEAAAAHGFTIVSVLARSDGSGAEGGGLRGDGDSLESCRGIRSLYCASPDDGEDDGAAGREMGTITEVLSSGLRLRISPLAFFQASTSAADVLFATILELVARSSPDRRKIVARSWIRSSHRLLPSHPRCPRRPCRQHPLTCPCRHHPLTRICCWICAVAAGRSASKWREQRRRTA